MATPTFEKNIKEPLSHKLPSTFIARRLHSLLGLWLAIYLFEHLLVNSQAALFFYDDGLGFISMVNKIHALPYLKVIEITLLGLPFLLHGLWGIAYLRGAKLNSFRGSGQKPSIPQYKTNRAYSWQRITSWILLIGIIAHVVQMRFLEYPIHVAQGDRSTYLFIQKNSPFLESMQERYDLNVYESIAAKSEPTKRWLEAASSLSLKQGQVIVEAPSAGIAFLLLVRSLFTDPMMVILYSIFVITACFHAYNGLWTALITWGVLVSHRAQKNGRKIIYGLMIVVIFLGLTAAWGSYLL